jgi:hypothetical protein
VALISGQSWDEVTRAAFGVSAQAFEAGWHDYLRWRYELK